MYTYGIYEEQFLETKRKALNPELIFT